MKLKHGFMLREIAGQWVVIPLGARTVEFNAILNLSETAALIWKMIENGIDEEAIVDRITQEYDVETDVAIEDYRSFVKDLISKGLLENE